MALEVEAIRPDRSFPRDIKSTKPKRFHPNYTSYRHKLAFLECLEVQRK
jgi:hypothetical protein